MATCREQFDINLAANCPDWTQLVWTPPTFDATLPCNAVGGTFAGNGGAVNAATTFPCIHGCNVCCAVGTLIYTGPQCNCKVNLNVTGWTLPNVGAIEIGLKITQDGVTILTYGYGAIANPGAVVLPFTVQAGVNSLIHVVGNGAGGASRWITSFVGAGATISGAYFFTIVNV